MSWTLFFFGAAALLCAIALVSYEHQRYPYLDFQTDRNAPLVARPDITLLTKKIHGKFSTPIRTNTITNLQTELAARLYPGTSLDLSFQMRFAFSSRTSRFRRGRGRRDCQCRSVIRARCIARLRAVRSRCMRC
jgi:hypothetical protein